MLKNCKKAKLAPFLISVLKICMRAVSKCALSKNKPRCASCTPGEHRAAAISRREPQPKVERRQIEFCTKAIVGCERGVTNRKKHFLPLLLYSTKEVDGIARGSVSPTERPRSAFFAQAPYVLIPRNRSLGVCKSSLAFLLHANMYMGSGCDAAESRSGDLANWVKSNRRRWFLPANHSHYMGTRVLLTRAHTYGSTQTLALVRLTCVIK